MSCLAVCGLLCLIAVAQNPASRNANGPAAKSEEPPDLLGIRTTQLTVRLGKEQFRATVLAKEGPTLTILTAAHCVAERDQGASLLVRSGTTVLRGKVVRAAQNPDYRPIPARDPQSKRVRGILCVDNAVAVIRLEPRRDEERKALEAIGTAELAQSPPLDTGIRTIIVHIVDQRGTLHVVTAGNHLNPKCLAWGRASYYPQPGDSGAGVFFIVEPAGASPRRLLVGNVALSDDRGGIAPLVSRSNRWVEEALGKETVVKSR